MKARPSALAVWFSMIAVIAVVTAAAKLIGLNASTVGFAYLIAVLLISVWGGRLLVGTVASIIATLSYNFFFFPPYHTLTIEEPANWFALAAFLVSSVTVNRLVAAARMQAEKAEQRRAEIEALSVVRESEALKTSLLRAIAHDLTTPITAITIRTESLRRRASADADLLEDVGAIAEETSRLRRRIDNLLAMARLEAGKSKPHPEPVPPADLFRATRENLPLVIAARPVSVRVDDDCPDANVDPSLALEILVNLVENAHKFSPPRAAIELVARKNGDGVRIEVLDRGPGMQPGIDDAGGLGLGIARSLAAANGGSVVLVPREGGGTIARVDLPAAVLKQ